VGVRHERLNGYRWSWSILVESKTMIDASDVKGVGRMDEQFTYRDFNLLPYRDVGGLWHVDYWWRSDPDVGGTEQSRKLIVAKVRAKQKIDQLRTKQIAEIVDRTF